MARIIGIDIGSSTSKGVITRNGTVSAYRILQSGINYRKVAAQLKKELLAEANLPEEAIDDIVTTGHGGGDIGFDSRHITGIRCCARGINRLFPSVRTIIDVQSQYTQVIRINDTGQVTGFLTSEKCAAGSGSFLEIVANVLQIELDDIGPMSLESDNPVAFTTGCAVFGESEAVSRVAEGFRKEDILNGIHEALADKITSLVERIGLEEECAVSGGGALNTGLIKKLENSLGVVLRVPVRPRIVNAFGATIIAGETYSKGE